MNCEQCQELISLFLDNELDEKNSSGVRMHIAVCAGCARICEEFAMILDFCALDEADAAPPPNAKALWCRINNIIESEFEPEIRREISQTPVKTGLLSKIRRNNWQFSFSQVLASVLGIALISSLLTFVGFKNYTAAEASGYTANATVAPTVFEKVLGKVGLIETPEEARARRVTDQQAAIDYWNKRVEARRVNWNNHLRQAFDRNLNEVNQVVFEYDKILRENPQDELSGEMLDSALSDKMELLREFSDL
ncbi:MAG TPA: zf-HC2 domain-containing protein [Pyrinomonadaceae bacterium]|nr:zf-HC2 domain-containing protein [Pyrinomonadaceae bacterium]